MLLLIKKKKPYNKGEYWFYDDDLYLIEDIGSYIYRNEYPKCVETLWDKLPEEGQRVEVDYGNSTNNYIWFIGGKFVNKYGFEMNGVRGWRPYNCH